MKLQTRLLYRRLVSATSMIATLEDSFNRHDALAVATTAASRKSIDADIIRIA
jgi:hypothetical protein